MVGTRMQQFRSGSRNDKGRKRNPSSVRMKQFGPYLIPAGSGYRHPSEFFMKDESFFRYAS